MELGQRRDRHGRSGAIRQASFRTAQKTCKQMKNPHVSVVMVVFNVDRFLSESIESVLNQTFRDFEFIIVDFGSTDDSKSIIARYAAKDSRIKFHAIPHCGLAAARNAACSLAHGQYIAIMDADDVSLPDRLMWEIEFMEVHPEIGLLGGATEWINPAGKPMSIDSFPTADREIRSELAMRSPFCHSAVLIRSHAFSFVEGYRGAFAQAEDYDLWLRIAEHFGCANLKQVVLKHRIHPHQISIRNQREQTLCRLAAQASAAFRRNGIPDPLNSVEVITPAVLAGLDVTDARQQSEVAFECQRWIQHQLAAGEYSAALNAAVDLLQSDLKYVEKPQIADLYLMVARLYWREKKYWNGGLAAIRAVITRPVVANSLLKSLRRRLGPVRSEARG